MSRAVAITLVIGFHLVIPLALLSWLALARPPSRLHWLARLLLTSSFLVLLTLGGAGWAWVGSYIPSLLLLLLLGAAGFSWHRIRGSPWVALGTVRRWLSLTLLGTGTLVFLIGVAFLLSGRRSYQGGSGAPLIPLARWGLPRGQWREHRGAQSSHGRSCSDLRP